MPPSPVPDSTGRRVGIWIRVSTEDQAQGDSPEHHEARARMYAESRGWKVVETYRLEGVSGKAVSQHAETVRMLRDVAQGKIGALIFSKLARLARNTRELLDFAETFQKHGCDLVSLQESIDTSTPAGRLFYTMIAAMAQWEREEIAERAAASVPIRAKLGKHIGGLAPFGYQWKDNALVPHPDEAPVRRRVHELFLELRRIDAVAKALNDAGHRTRKGLPFRGASIEVMLRDPTPKGEHFANRHRHDKAAKTRSIKPESEWIVQKVEPILPAEVWDAGLAILGEDRRGKGKPRSRRVVHLFSGLLHCECGQKMYVPSNTPKYVCQECRNKIPVEDLESIFLEQLEAYMVSPTEIAAYLERTDRSMAEQRDLLAMLRREEKALRAEMDKTYRLYLDDKITSEGFGVRYKPMEERLAQLGEEIPRIESSLDFLKVNLLSGDRILAEAKNLSALWPELEGAEKRTIVETLVEKITLCADGELEIDLFFVPSLLRTEPDPPPTDSGPSPTKPRSKGGSKTNTPSVQEPDTASTSSDGPPLATATPGLCEVPSLRPERAKALAARAFALSQKLATSSTTRMGRRIRAAPHRWEQEWRASNPTPHPGLSPFNNRLPGVALRPIGLRFTPG